MSTLRVIFTNSRMPLAPVIRAVTWSKFSHMALLFDDNKKILHADMHGVRIEETKALQARSKNWMIVDYKCDRPDDLINACMTQLGKPYDFTGIIGIAIRDVNLQDTGKWWCSELPAYGAVASGQPFFQDEYMSRITPQHWLMLPHTIITRG